MKVSLTYLFFAIMTIIMGFMSLFNIKVETDFINWTNFLIMVAITFLIGLEDTINEHLKGGRKEWKKKE